MVSRRGNKINTTLFDRGIVYKNAKSSYLQKSQIIQNKNLWF